jgi:hypothetical protein
MGSIRVGAQRLDKACLGRWHQLREHGKVAATRRGQLERCTHIDTDHVAARREPQLALAGDKHLPSLMLLAADQSVLAVGAEPTVGSGLASGAGQVVVAAGSAVLGPSA